MAGADHLIRAKGRSKPHCQVQAKTGGIVGLLKKPVEHLSSFRAVAAGEPGQQAVFPEGFARAQWMGLHYRKSSSACPHDHTAASPAYLDEQSRANRPPFHPATCGATRR